jgi:hypothetical protein
LNGISHPEKERPADKLTGTGIISAIECWVSFFIVKTDAFSAAISLKA